MSYNRINGVSVNTATKFYGLSIGLCKVRGANLKHNINSALFPDAHASHSGALVGVSDSGAFTFSVWYDPTGSDGVAQGLFRIDSGVTQRFNIQRTTTNVIRVSGSNSSGTTVLDQTGTTQITSAFGYANIVMRCNLAGTPSFNMWINGTGESVTSTTLTPDGVIDLAPSSPIQYVGNATTKLFANMAGLWFDDTDLGASAHLLFGQGAPWGPWGPIPLGSNGSRPKGGVATALFLSTNGNGTSWLTDSSGNGNTFTTASGTIGNGTPPST